MSRQSDQDKVSAARIAAMQLIRRASGADPSHWPMDERRRYESLKRAQESHDAQLFGKPSANDAPAAVHPCYADPDRSVVRFTNETAARRYADSLDRTAGAVGFCPSPAESCVCQKMAPTADTKAAALRQRFGDLVRTLRPDVLSWNGALSARQVKTRRESLQRQWAALEQALGRPVSVEEAERWAHEAEDAS